MNGQWDKVVRMVKNNFFGDRLICDIVKCTHFKMKSILERSKISFRNFKIS